MYLYKTFEFASFEEAIDFMRRAATIISRLNHHPEWTNRYNRVEVWITTHDQGDVVTNLDRQLAGELDKLYADTPSAVTKTQTNWELHGL
ncbi:MAG: pterin-4-alpha-carbinolamine dehydratase [Sphingomonadales bacterium]|nr:pterin-4-alpha-carbinolamine dehydratase [Sphingomonadales bacterium]